MSLGALLQATRDTLRQTIGIRETDCDVQPKGQPTAIAGQVYIGLFGLDWHNETPSMMSGIDELYGVGAMVTIRIAQIPVDRFGGDAYIKPLIGLEAWCRKVMVAVHQNYDLMNLANSLIPDHPNLLEQPLFWSDTQPEPELQDETWFRSNPKDSGPTVCGMSMLVRFVDARRTIAQDNLK